MTKLEKRMLRCVYSRQRVWDVCYHEAGHAVAAMLLGLGVLNEKVKIRTHDKGSRRLGLHVIFPGHVVTEGRGTNQSGAIFATAGWLAEKLFDPRTDGHKYLDLDKQTFKEVMDVQEEVYMNLWLQYCEGETLKFVQTNWRYIRVVAQALIRQKHHTLARKQIIRLLQKTELDRLKAPATE